MIDRLISSSPFGRSNGTSRGAAERCISNRRSLFPKRGIQRDDDARRDRGPSWLVSRYRGKSIGEYVCCDIRLESRIMYSLAITLVRLLLSLSYENVKGLICISLSLSLSISLFPPPSISVSIFLSSRLSIVDLNSPVASARCSNQPGLTANSPH